jgi:hypothetical protein
MPTSSGFATAATWTPAAIALPRPATASKRLAATTTLFQPGPSSARVLRELPEGERRVLEVLIQAFPREVERTSIDGATGYQRSSRDAYLQRLRSRELVIHCGRGAVRANETLFEGAA